jgi:hypothetical protein
MVAGLSCKHKTLSSNPTTTKKQAKIKNISKPVYLNPSDIDGKSNQWEKDRFFSLANIGMITWEKNLNLLLILHSKVQTIIY